MIVFNMKNLKYQDDDDKKNKINKIKIYNSKYSNNQQQQKKKEINYSE